MKRISKCQLWKLLKGYWASSNEDLREWKGHGGESEATAGLMLTMRATGLASPAYADWEDWTILDDELSGVSTRIVRKARHQS